MIKIYFLGSGAASPSIRRWHSSIAIEVNSEIGLLDCGEGCQIRLQQVGLSPLKIRFVAITHLHGDHFIGLLPLLQSMTLFSRKDNLYIIAPKEIRDLVDVFLNVSKHKLSFNLEYLEPTDTHIFNRISVKGFRVCHSIESMGYLVEINYRGFIHKICYTGDTRPCEDTVNYCKKANILIHDATFSSEDSEEAVISGHSTVIEAAEVALRAEVEKLYLTHFSSRYRDEDKLVSEARRIFKNTILVKDLDLVIIP
ncbi:MAG: ribonuclease Z [Sulfolobales archaeon]